MLMPWVDLAPDYVLGVVVELVNSEVADCVLAGLIVACYMLSTPQPGSTGLMQVRALLAVFPFARPSRAALALPDPRLKAVSFVDR
jgi:hypothetical protein